MDPASTQEPERLKHARISDPMVTFAKQQSPKRLRPIEAAKRTAELVIKTLPPDMITLAEFHSSEFLKLRTELAKLDSSKVKLANDDYFPKSARFKFSLGASERVKENATLAFDSLAEKTKLVLWSFNDDLKRYISASIDLEIKVLREEISKKFCLALNAMVISFGITKGLTTSLSQTLALYTVLTNENAKLFQWTETKEEDFIPTFETAIHDMTPVAEFGRYSEENIRMIEEHVPHLLYVISGIYASAWDAYIAAEDELRKQEKLKVYLALQLKERATPLTAMDLDLEDAYLTQASLIELIADQIAQATRPMHRNSEYLKKQLAIEKAKNSKLKPSPKATNSSSSNSNPGAKNASAPLQKEKKARSNQETTPEKPTDPTTLLPTERKR